MLLAELLAKVLEIAAETLPFQLHVVLALADQLFQLFDFLGLIFLFPVTAFGHNRSPFRFIGVGALSTKKPFLGDNGLD